MNIKIPVFKEIKESNEGATCDWCGIEKKGWAGNTIHQKEKISTFGAEYGTNAVKTGVYYENSKGKYKLPLFGKSKRIFDDKEYEIGYFIKDPKFIEKYVTVSVTPVICTDCIRELAKGIK